MAAKQFTLDTSGLVGPVNLPSGTQALAMGWAHLSDFARGYAEAALRELDAQRWAHYRANLGKACVPLHPTYSWLHPDALAMILRDCEAWRALYPESVSGQSFWRCRQEQLVERTAFPPLRVYLDDAGKMRLEVAQ